MAGIKLTYNGVEYENDISLKGGAIELSHSALGETLSADSALIPITTGGAIVRLLAADQGPNDFLKTADGEILCVSGSQPAPVYVKNGPGQLYFNSALLAKMYLDELQSDTENAYDLKFYSAIHQLIMAGDHLGGMYSGETVADVLSEIIGDLFAYTVDETVAAIEVIGYLKIANKRDNLQMLMMSKNITIRKNSDGTPRFTASSDVVAGTFNEDRMYKGGKVADITPITAVRVTEYKHIESAEEATLYTGTPDGTQTIYFDAPYHDLQITGGTIDASGANYCTFHGTSVTITGQKYIQVTRIVTHGTAPTGAPGETVKYIKDNTLITSVNSAVIAENFYNLLTAPQIIRRDVMVGTEMPGDVVNITNPKTGELVQACLMSMSMDIGGSILKAAAEFLVGYIPPGAAAGFENHVVLTGAGTYTIPAGVTNTLVIRAGGGDGGHGGSNGTNATAGTTGIGGAGGEKGEAGQGGLIDESNLTVTPGATFDYNCGAGGTGGAAGAAGTPGEATTFGVLTSATGRRYPSGYSEPKSGLLLAANGDDGVDGGRGNNYGNPGPSITYDGVTYNPGADGTRNFYPGYGTAYEGGGGGSAVGSNGSDGGDGQLVTEFIPNFLVNGEGGHGANATDAESATDYGAGGQGGHGGGGGGWCVHDTHSSDGGLGGTGSAGGDGAPGVIVVYY